MRIPILDLHDDIEKHRQEYQAALSTVLDSTHFILGKHVQDFERQVAEYLGVKHAIGCNSGTDALIIGLRALGVGPGDEVITSPFTFFATAEAVTLVGAKPVFVDIEPNSLNLDVDRIEEAISARTKAIIPVHLFGLPANMEAVLKLAAERNLTVLEDVAQAMGAEYQGRKAGSLGHFSAFSFFPSKNLGAFGDAGLMATNDVTLADQARLLRVHGSRKRYYHEAIGYNSRMDEMQAAILLVKLKYLDEANRGRRQVAHRYNEIFKGVPGLTTPHEVTDSTHVFHQYTVRIADGKRDRAHARLAEKGIGTMIYYPVPLHALPMYQANAVGKLGHTEKAADEVLSLPIWPTLSTEKQIEVSETLIEVLKTL